MHTHNIIQSGVPLTQANKVLVMIHGRGGNAEDILTLADYFDLAGFALLAPQATNNSWYPYSFLAPVSNNEPGLSSAIATLDSLITEVNKAGIASANVFLLGFSQGACLSLEYAARRAQRYGGIIAFTGGLIGESVNSSNYTGDFNNTPLFIGTSDPDPHVPLARVNQSAELLKTMGAAVDLRVYKNMGHTINQDEIAGAAEILSLPDAQTVSMEGQKNK